MLMLCFSLPSYTCGELDEQVGIIGLDLSVVCRLVADGGTAFFAAMDKNKSALRVGESLDRSEKTAAIVCPVPGIHVNVKGAKAERAMVTRGVAKRKHLFAAILAYKPRIVFLKSLFFHIFSLSHAEFREYIADDLFAYSPAVEL